MAEAVVIPGEKEILEVVRQHPSALQFKNSLRYIQGGTNMTLDRMIERFDIVLGQVYTEGMQRGIAIAQALNEGGEIKVKKPEEVKK